MSCKKNGSKGQSSAVYKVLQKAEKIIYEEVGQVFFFCLSVTFMGPFYSELHLKYSNKK